MLAGGSIYHSIIATNVSSILHRQFDTRPCAVFNSDIRLQLSKSRYVYPDVSVSCDQRDLERGNTIHYPCIVIEILSPGTEVIDRVKKLRYYREHPTIQAYIMIDSQKVSVEMYRRVSKGWMLETFDLNDTLEIEDLAIQIPIEEVYRKITF